MRTREVLTICPATPDDAVAILALQKLAYEPVAKLYNDWSLPPLTQDLESLRAEFASTTILKAISEARLVGSVRGKVALGTCEIARLMVHPGFQGRGIGVMLMQHIERCFPCVSRYELFTGSRLEANICFYQRLGYSISHTRVISPDLSFVILEKNGLAAAAESH
jgi:GNAT superfamily N-acetyltransferase